MTEHEEAPAPAEPAAPAVLAVDVGGSHVKMLLNGESERRRFVSKKKLTPGEMVSGVLERTADWNYEVVSVGVPAPVQSGRVVHDPVNLGKGWVGFDFEAAFAKPTKVINDAAMQALGSYEGGRMLFLGLGTGLGSAMIVDGILEPMELAHLPFRNGTFEDVRRERWNEEARPEAVAKGRSRDDRAPGGRSRARVRRPRRWQRRSARRASGERASGPQRRRLPGRFPPLDRRAGRFRRRARTLVMRQAPRSWAIFCRVSNSSSAAQVAFVALVEW